MSTHHTRTRAPQAVAAVRTFPFEAVYGIFTIVTILLLRAVI